MGTVAEQSRIQGTARKTVALVGQPNVGKSLVFFRLTGQYVSCSNYPGTTVELFRGTTQIGDQSWQVLDTPGVVGLTSSSEAEQVTRDILLFGDVDAVVQVADAKNIERTLQLFIQLAELGLPLVLDLNLTDERRARGLEYSVADLARQLGIPVVETVATTGEGLEALGRAISEARVPQVRVEYGSPMGSAIKTLEKETRGCAWAGQDLEINTGSCCTRKREAVGGNGQGRNHGPGLAALVLALPPQGVAGLLGKLSLSQDARERIDRLVADVRARTSRPSYEIAVARQNAVARILRESPLRRREDGARKAGVPDVVRSGWVGRLGRWTVHPLWGTLILLGVLYGMYQFVGNLGAQVLVG